jgi:hypothetical protein
MRKRSLEAALLSKLRVVSLSGLGIVIARQRAQAGNGLISAAILMLPQGVVFWSLKVLLGIL